MDCDVPMSRASTWSDFGVDAVPAVGCNVKTPKITIMVKGVLM